MMHALGFVTSCECESPPRKDVAPHLGPVLEVHPFCDGLGGLLVGLGSGLVDFGGCGVGACPRPWRADICCARQDLATTAAEPGPILEKAGSLLGFGFSWVAWCPFLGCWVSGVVASR